MAIPADVRTEIVLSDADLDRELLDMTDHFTDELFVLPDGQAEAVLFPVSRLVIDPERFLDDAQEPMAQRGMGVVYTLTSEGRPLRREVSAARRAELIGRFYTPHHAALSHAVRQRLDAWGYCLVIDCHSFPSRPLPYEPDQRSDRPEICLGTDPFHTPPRLADRAQAAFEARGLSVERNRPFSGALVPSEHYEANPAVQALMIEVNRGLYVDEQTGARKPGFAEVAETVQEVVRHLADQARKAWTP